MKQPFADRWVLRVGRQSQDLLGHWFWGLGISICMGILATAYLIMKPEHFLGYFYFGATFAWIAQTILSFERRQFYRIILRYDYYLNYYKKSTKSIENQSKTI
jgi:hypothetical protein